MLNRVFCRQHRQWNLNMWGTCVMLNDESRFCLWKLDGRVKVRRRRGERYADCCTDRVTAFGGALPVAPSLAKQGDIGMRFCSQWRSHISTIWDLTPSSKMTTLAPTEPGLSQTTSRMWEEREWNGLPTVQTSSQLNTCGISLGVLYMLEWPTQPHWLTCNDSWSLQVRRLLLSWSDQHEEEVPGCCGCIWIFHLLLRLMTVY